MELKMENKKLLTGFYTFENHHGKKNIGGTRLRAHWPIEKWKDNGPDIGEAELFTHGRKYDILIYQKAYWFQHAEYFDGIKILDLCDPDFLEPGYPVKRMIEACDAVTCSSEKLAIEVAKFAGDKPVWFIPDCVLDPQKEPMKKHEGSLSKVAWYGYAENFPALNTALTAIVKRGLELIVVGTDTFTPPPSIKGLNFTNYPWKPETWVEDFMRADVVINPKISSGRFAFKSDNKTVQAWAVGMPVADFDTDFDKLETAEARNKEGAEKRQWVIENRDVKIQVGMLKDLILEIQKNKANPVSSG